MSWRLQAVVQVVGGVTDRELTDWIERGWLRPAGLPPDWVFAAHDLARVRLVRDLRHEAGIDEDHLAMVLSLLTQLNEARSTVRALAAAIRTQPESVRDAILAELDRSEPDNG